MSRIKIKFLDTGVGADQVNSRGIPANFTPSGYTPTQVSAEGTDKISAHLNGIDAKVAKIESFDIKSTAFSGSQSQTNANVTGLLLNTAVQTAQVIIDVKVTATADLYESYSFLVKKKASSYDWNTAVCTGDISNASLSFDINSSGQFRYTSSTFAGFTSLIMTFRVITVS
jgi:hypothetical protein